jgi:Predicted redox protein, regulator of disulfide bond formation
MEARVRWIENAAFMAETGSGHAIVIDGPEHIGGRNLGPRPMELMLLSIGSCSSVDVVHILKKARQPVSGCEVKVSGTRADTDPQGLHRHSSAFHGQRRRAVGNPGGAGRGAVRKQVLLGLDHARQGCRDQPRFRDRPAAGG